MSKKTKLILIICLPLLGILAGYYLMTRQLTIIVDGVSSEVTTRAMTVRGALRSAGITLNPQDQVAPAASSWLSGTTLIIVERARKVWIWDDSTSQLFEITTAALTPAEMLSAAGILTDADDLVRINGTAVPLNEAVALAGNLTLQYTLAVSLTIDRDGSSSIFETTAPNLGLALWEQNIHLYGGDALNQPFTAAVDPNSPLTINSAVHLIITADGRDIDTFVSAPTVGEALAVAGITLQDLDFSRPSETDPLPEDGRIEVVRVKEEIIQEQQSIPYSTESTKVDNLDYGVKQVVKQGEVGLQMARLVIRYENGVEVSRTNLETVVLKDPVNQIENVGTRVTAQTATDTSCAGVQYYLALAVTTTSYSPCNSGTSDGSCSYQTALGTTVEQGTLAVSSTWFQILKGTQICIPGYGIGTVEDTGSYPNNPKWIDLGYTDAQLAAVPRTEWTHHNLTVYFLSPKAAELGQ